MTSLRSVGYHAVGSSVKERDLPPLKIPLMANSHPLQVNPEIGFLRTFEGFGFVSGLPLPDKELVFARPAVSGMTGNGFDITADSLDHFSVGHGVVNVPHSI